MVDAQPARRAAWLMPLGFGAVACAVVALSAAGARHTPLIRQHVEAQAAQQARENAMYVYDNGYLDGGDEVVLNQIPNDDYSRGGVYFIGDSQMWHSLMPWRLTPAESNLIHNYSIGDLRHRDVLHLLRMLVEQADLLQAGGERTTVFLCLSPEMAREPTPGYVEALFERHGFYSYDWTDGIRIIDMSAFERTLRLYRYDATRFLRTVVLRPNQVASRRQIEQTPAYQARPNWREPMDEELAFLAQTLDYLQARGVRVRGLYFPEGSWRRGLDYSEYYRERVTELLSSRNIPLIDHGTMLADDEFGDAVHSLYSGQVKLHDAYLQLAREALEAMGTSIEQPAPVSNR